MQGQLRKEPLTVWFIDDGKAKTGVRDILPMGYDEFGDFRRMKDLTTFRSLSKTIVLSITCPPADIWGSVTSLVLEKCSPDLRKMVGSNTMKQNNTAV